MNFEKYAPLFDKNSQLTPNQEVNLLDGMREDFLKASGLWGHPKCDELMAQAWKQAHEFGPKEILRHLDDLANSLLFVPGDIKYNQ